MIASVSDKTDIDVFVKALHARHGNNLTVISTSKTADAITAAGVPVMQVSEFTGSPEVMGGRVKTLHPKIYGGILARLDVPSDGAELFDKLRSALIDLVVVNLYPFAETASKPGISFDDLTEQIDIGGPSLVRAAAKNFRRVTVVVDPGDYFWVAESLMSEQVISLEDRFKLMKKAFHHTAAYDSVIASTLDEFDCHGETFIRNNTR